MTLQSAMSRRAVLAGTTGLGLTGLLGLTPSKARAATQRITLDVREVDGAPTYNGVSPGQTIYADPGDTIDVHLINSLPRLDDDCVLDFNSFHGRNTTNLHTHGLHVSPTTDVTGEFDADNVFVSVTPANQFVPCAEVCGSSVEKTFRIGEAYYRFELGADHPSGTFWYHAHKHGSTSPQVGAGLSGPLIVRDRPGAMPAYIEQAPEQIIMILNRGVVLVDPQGGGTLDPTITLRPGEVQRWRVINAQSVVASFAYLRTGIPELEMHLIAFDGLTLDRRVQVETDFDDEPWLNPAALAPGNRADFLVRVPPDLGETESSAGRIARFADAVGLGPSTNAADVNVVVEGDPVDHPWTDDVSLPGSGLTPFDNTPLDQRTVRFSPQFGVDGEKFDGQVVHSMVLGTSEEWTIENATGGIHAFHIHVNPFFVTHINGVELGPDDPLRRWQDTIGLPLGSGANPGTVTYKTRFESFTGAFVIHCHILRHEDLGMMQTVEVVPPA